MTRFRYWLADDVLLELVRRVHPPRKDGAPKGKKWQIIEVPRRISQTEAEMLAAQVRDL